MSDKEETVKKYLGDMIAVERYIADAAEQQLDRGRFPDHPEAQPLVTRIKNVTVQHVHDLEQELERLGGGEPSKGVKETVTGAIGSVIDMVQQLRSEQASKMLRDHYTALGLTKISYVTLHTTALVLGQETVAELALRHRGDIPPLLSEAETAIIKVTARDLKEEVGDADVAAAEVAVRNLQQAA